MSLRREGETIRAHAEEARKVAAGYHEMAKRSQQMADYAEERADYAMASRADTIADNIDLLMNELKDGLMEILQSFPDEGIAQELALWKDQNDFVSEVYLWQGDLCLMPGQKIAGQSNLEDLPLFNHKQDWVWNTIDPHESVLAQNSSNKPSPLQQDGVSDLGTPSLTASLESKAVSGDARTNSQQSEVFKNAQTSNNSLDDLPQINQEDFNPNPSGQLSVELEQQNRVIAQKIQSMPKNKAWASSAYLNDNYRNSQKARQELRDQVQNDLFSNLQKQSFAGKLEQLPTSEPNGGWQYLNGSQGRLWGCWFSNKPTFTRGLQIDSKELEEKLKTALPEQVDEDECFVLMDEKGVEVCSVGEVVSEGEEVSRAIIQLGEKLPGWTLLATRRKPPAITLPEFKSPEGNSLALVGEGWSGYVAVSSVMAVILVGSTLLGGAVLLIQVRRNSLEAVRKTTFVSNVSHELKTPLTTIRMYGEMLGDGLVKDESKRRNYLSTIIGESQRLTRLVNNVLDFSRMERGEKNYNLEELDLSRTIKDILDAQYPRLVGEGFAVEWIAPDEKCPMKADRDALEQVLLNLLDNVVKYAAEGKFIEVRVISSQDEVSFEVADHGPGIPTEQLERVFDTFHRVDDSLTASQPGCGLGLGIARKLVEGMGGVISCEKNEPRGIRFRIVFPGVSDS